MTDEKKTEEAPCQANAELIIFRGRVKRLWLCEEHRSRYTGKGRVMSYGWPDSDADFTGDTRRCGETVGPS